MKITLTLPKVNPWIIFSLVLIALLAIALLQPKPQITGAVVLSKEEVGKKVVNYINANLVQPGTSASLVKVEDMGNFYKILTSYQGQQIPVYASKDGKYMFLQLFNLSERLERPQQPQQSQRFDAPDREVPEANLFVMSFCPFGVQAEQLMKPVVELLNKKADIKVRFIVNVVGNTIDSVRSLHGSNEAKEDARQACIQKHYPQEIFWNYLMEIADNCFSIYRDESRLEECWKAAAAKLKIDVDKVEKCAYGLEGLELLKVDEALASQHRVTGSPTLLINGERYVGERSSEAFKQAICSGFITPPVECSQTLAGGQASSPAGGC